MDEQADRLRFKERCVNLFKRTSTKNEQQLETVARLNRAVSGTRTRDPRLGKPMLYQLSYYRIDRRLENLRRRADCYPRH